MTSAGTAGVLNTPNGATTIRWLRPGHLLAPLGWAAEHLATMAQTEAALLLHILELDRKRMHLLALVFAHGDSAPSEELARLLATAPARDILNRTLAHSPPGLLGALGRLPDEVISPEGYRRLVELMYEPHAAKLLRHARSIDESDIRDLYALPVGLRRSAVVGAFDWLDSMAGLEEALCLFVRSGAAPNFDSVLKAFASASDPAQLRAKVRKLVEALPLPASLPPSQLGPAHRLDQAADLRALAKRWRNCLASYVDDVDRGEKAVYIWEEPQFKAVCLVERRARLGWFLGDVKRPRNRELNPDRLERVQRTFAAAGIPLEEVADAIEHLCIEDDAPSRWTVD